MAKKQIPLRINDELYGELAKWAEDDFRSINGQIEYLLNECVKWRKKGMETKLNGKTLAALADFLEENKK